MVPLVVEVDHQVPSYFGKTSIEVPNLFNKKIVLARKVRSFYAILYKEFFGNPGGGGSSTAITVI